MYNAKIKNNIIELKIALYCRLSNEDGDKVESNSIKSQKAILQDYVKNHLENIHHIEEYIDDGYTGLNTNRPSFLKMLEDIKQGTINCVIVKDLSRLGRNSWEIGKYLEQIFPFFGVRFISINDNLDSGEENFNDNMLIPIKTLMNEAFSRDISDKIRTQFEIKRKQGEFISNFAPYGYKKSKENHNKLVVDENVRAVIEDIFKWKIEGISNLDIAKKLNNMGVLSPMEYKQSMGLNYDIVFKKNEKALWTHTSVGRILINEIYIGHMVQGKKRTPNLKVKKFFDVPKEKWTRVENTHEPIIKKEEFKLVQELLNIDTKKSPSQEKLYVFSGLLKCKDCGDTMVRVTVTDKGKKYFYYVCANYKYRKSCTSHRISEKKLIKAVTKLINDEISRIVNIDEIIKNIEKWELKNISISNLNEHIKSLRNEIGDCENYKKGLLEVYSKELVDEKFFTTNMQIYTNQINEIKSSIENVKKEIEEVKKSEFLVNSTIETFKVYKGFKELTRKLVVNLIENIFIMENKQIIVNFKYSREFLLYENLKLEVENG